jgi:hypothetical protein
MPFTAFTYGDPAIEQLVLVYPTPFLNAGLQPGIAAGTNAPTWGTWNMPPGDVGIAYDAQWYLEGCATPVTFTLASGSLPPGLSLSTLTGAEGEISGTPTTAGTYSFTLTATNAYGSASQSFSITILTPSSSGGGAWTFFG